MQKEELISILSNKGSKFKISIISDNPFEPTIYEIDISDIESVEILDSEDYISVVDLINASEDLETALKYTSETISFEEEKALDNLKERLNKKRFEKQVARIKNMIETEIGLSRSKLTVSEVLSFMCENILGTNEIAYTLDTDTEIAFVNKIKWAIQKLEKVGW